MCRVKLQFSLLLLDREADPASISSEDGEQPDPACISSEDGKQWHYSCMYTIRSSVTGSAFPKV